MECNDWDLKTPVRSPALAKCPKPVLPVNDLKRWKGSWPVLRLFAAVWQNYGRESTEASYRLSLGVRMLTTIAVGSQPGILMSAKRS